MPVLAEVYTTQKTDDSAACVYVLGNHDSYPLEYYNAATERFEGVLPDVLTIISKNSGIDFAYINSHDKNIEELAETLQADIISCYNIKENSKYAKNVMPVFAYSQNITFNTIGFAFTKYADDETKATLQTFISTIPQKEIDNLLMKYLKNQGNSDPQLISIIIALGLIFAVLAILLFAQNKIDKLTDGETGIGNLAYFKYQFEDSISDFQRSMFYVAYIVLDSSYLRSYYDEATFSDVMKYTAVTLSSHTADNGFAARITENGFSVVFKSTNDDEAQLKLEEIIKSLDEYVDVSKNSVNKVFHSTLYHLNQEDTSSEIVLFNLRKNCNKILGTNVEIMVCDNHAMNKVLEEKQTVENIIRGFAKDEFKLFLQFIVDAKAMEISSAEALSRWDNQEQGLLSPGRYIGIMERDGLISQHDFYIFEKVCQQLEKWHNTEFSHIMISSNFTRITLSESDFIDKIKAICDKYTFDKSNICIEITEDAIEKNVKNALFNIAECKKLGFRIALDDMGSGYTSLANLCDYPIDVVKVDRDILLKANNERGKSLFEGIVELSHKLKLKVICEGVETEEQKDFVQNSNCDFIQGFYYYKPLSQEESENILMQKKVLCFNEQVR